MIGLWKIHLLNLFDYFECMKQRWNMISEASFLLQNTNQFERLGHYIFFSILSSITNEMQKMNQFMLKSVASFSFNPVCGFHFNLSAARRSGPCLVLQCTVLHLVPFLSGPNKCPSFQFTCICWEFISLNTHKHMTGQTLKNAALCSALTIHSCICNDGVR